MNSERHVYDSAERTCAFHVTMLHLISGLCQLMVSELQQLDAVGVWYTERAGLWHAVKARTVALRDLSSVLERIVELGCHRAGRATRKPSTGATDAESPSSRGNPRPQTVIMFLRGRCGTRGTLVDLRLSVPPTMWTACRGTCPRCGPPHSAGPDGQVSGDLFNVTPCSPATQTRTLQYM